jgi:hypothetical protein
MTERLLCSRLRREYEMPTYRVYLIGRDQHIAGPPKVFECSDDDEVVYKAKQILDGHALEIWDGARHVGRLEPMHE